MAKQGSTRDRPNPRHCQSFELVNLTGRRSFGFHQGQRSAYRSAKAGYMTASSTAVLRAPLRLHVAEFGLGTHNQLQHRTRWAACRQITVRILPASLATAMIHDTGRFASVKLPEVDKSDSRDRHRLRPDVREPPSHNPQLDCPADRSGLSPVYPATSHRPRLFRPGHMASLPIAQSLPFPRPLPGTQRYRPLSPNFPRTFPHVDE